MPKKFQTYKCTICTRQVDKEFKPTYAKFPKCDITFGCNGTLKVVGEKNIGALHATFRSDVENWRPRNERLFITPITQAEEYIQISSSLKNTFTIGVDKRLIKNDPFGLDDSSNMFDTLELSVFQLLNKTTVYRDYIFRISAAQSANYSLSGDDSNGNAFYYTAENSLLVYLNGSPLVEGVNNDFVLSGESVSGGTVPLNSILFLIPIPAYSTIQVVVKKNEEVIEKKLKFSANSLLANIDPGSWSNINSITTCVTRLDGTFEDRTYILFTLENPAQLGFDVRVQPIFGANDNAIKLSSTVFPTEKYYSLGGNDIYNNPNTEALIGLFSERQFTCKDRDLTAYFKFAEITGSHGFLRYIKDANEYVWQISANMLKETPYLIQIESFISIDGITQYDPVITDSTDNLYAEVNNIKSSKILNV